MKNDGDTVTMASYTYTPEGLLETASYGSSRTLENTWDADSNRVKLNANGSEYEFVYDPTAGIPAVIQSIGDGSTSTAVVSYFREPSGSLISRVEGSNTHYYHFDALGSTRLLTNAGETVTVTDRYSYDAYGALLSHDRLSGSIDQPYQYVGQLGYYTHYQEPDFGLPQLGVRFYDPEVGRFTQRDPARAGINGFLGMSARPVSRVDPWGLFDSYSWWWWYFHMQGHEMNLNTEAPELMRGIRGLDPVRSMVRETWDNRREEAPGKAKEACAGRKSGKVLAGWIYSGSRGMNIVWSNFVLGDTSFLIWGTCSITADCCRHRYWYCCTATFTLDDWFRDPLDIGKELPGGTPYHITGSFRESTCGEGWF